MSLPEGYLEWVERVSNIVSFAFPFKGTNAEDKYEEWLGDYGMFNGRRWYAIDRKEYEKEACDVWTFIHLQL